MRVAALIVVVCERLLTLTAAGSTFDVYYPKIKLSSENDSITDSLSWKTYRGSIRNQANIPFKGALKGFVHQPYPKNGCHYVQPLPPGINDDTFALIEDYPSCVVDMIVNVRNAGYKLIIATSHNDTFRDVTPYINGNEFPVIIVKEKYTTYLKEFVAVENFADIDYQNVIKANIYIYHAIAASLISVFFVHNYSCLPFNLCIPLYAVYL